MRDLQPPQQAEIAHDFIDWRSPTSIKTEYGLTGRPTIYLHAHALGLFEKRQRNVRKALEHIIAQAGDVTVNAAAVVSAIQTYNKINALGQRIDRFPFLLILPIKSKLAYIEVELLLHARSRKTQKDLATVGTPHFAQFVPLGTTR